jgi:hypothetical protein
MASWDHDAGSRDTAQRSDLETVRSTAPFLDGGLSGANRGAVSSPAGLRAADAASLPNFVKSNNAEVGLIPQRRGTRSCPRVGTKKYSLCATHKSFGNAYRRGVKQDASSVHAGEPHQPVDTAAGCPLSKDGRGERAPEIIAAKLNRSVHAIKLRAYTIGLPLKWFRGKEPPTTLPKPLKAAISRASRTARTAQGRRNRQIIARNGLRTNGGHEGCTAASKLIQFVSDAHSLGAYIANYVCAGRTPEAREAVKQLLKLHPGFRASHANKAFPVRLSDLRNQITAAFREAGLPD